MFKVLIVDDEIIIRNGLHKIIGWNKLEISEVLTASCGKEALEIACASKPDIMLTDICMPEMDGLELTRLMLEMLPRLKVIVLTGYDDFKYAQKSCSLGVKDFILKPVDENKLTESIKIQIENIKNEMQSQLSENIISRKKMLESQREIEKSLIELTEKSANQIESINIPEKLALEEDCDYQVALVKPEISFESVWSQHGNLLMISIKSFIIDMVDSKNSGWTFQNRDGDIVIIFYVCSKYEDTREQIAKLQEIINVEFDVALNVGIGAVVCSMSEITFSYEQAKENCRQYSLEKDNNIPLVVQESYQSSNYNRLAYLKQKVIEHVNDPEKTKKYLKDYIDEVRASESNKSNAEQKFYDLAAAFYWEYLRTTGNSADGRLETLISTLQSNDMENCSAFTEMFIMKLMYSNKKQMHEIIEAATEYISQHFSEDLTVFTLAEQFHVARNYFSRLFKKEMGEGCNEYITRKRIEKAKQLLADSRLRTYEIAEQIGYHDTNYFSLAFKKNTGLSPKEFRDKLNNPE
ncbi:two-component system response regulator YesN [Ruminiclostridium sufflavum DSM 19573]|uniref:Stage 0 sporulation protein A homolog n=1 Tax=Ruminiclostridium sufflavum DSM 19573 TaxID=1121337 RepID=A0A318XKP9_9FIRM|nr:two-component system response regulator YesN [Ruminiclostridium sufflavum DSM 19573]